MFCEEFNDSRIYMVAIVLTGFDRHTDTTVRLQGTLKRLVCLKADNLFLTFVQVPWSVGRNRRDNLRVHIKHSAFCSLLLGQIHYLRPQLLCVLCRPCKKAVVT